MELGEALLRLLTQIAADRGCVLVLEDLHWADPDTVAVLEYLGDNLATAPVLCLATLRSESATPALRVARALTARRSATIVELRRLSAPELARMTELCLNTRVLPDGVGETVWRFSDGLPFLVEELLASAVDAGSLTFGDVFAGGGVAVPARFADLVQSRLAVRDRPPAHRHRQACRHDHGSPAARDRGPACHGRPGQPGHVRIPARPHPRRPPGPGEPVRAA